MSAKYVRTRYAVDYKVGERMTLHDHAACPAPDTGRCAETSHDRHGVLVSFPQQYLGVRFDGEKRTSRCHPTWRISRQAAPKTPGTDDGR
ncbi:hypothetical protein ACFWGN_14965 [Oerskovia sp. NPDC060338]|uniref:hypothetical protein n=1 Tax=Oerskovia sp. NPDC060338 TaxID=3347100 RepID=UPI00365FF9B3